MSWTRTYIRTILGSTLMVAYTLGSVATSALASPGDGQEAGWQTVHSDQNGFSVAIPDGWTLQEQAQPDGTVQTLLAGNGVGVGVTVGQPSDIPLDMPNTRCSLVTVAGTSGTLCSDTLAGSVTVSFDALGRAFRLTSGRGLDPATLQQILASFVPDGPAPLTAAPNVAPLAEPAALPTGDRCVVGFGASKARALCPAP